MKYRNTEVKNDSLGCIMDEFSIQKKEFRYIYVKKIIKEPIWFFFSTEYLINLSYYVCG